jgi:hypothetical protein
MEEVHRTAPSARKAVALAPAAHPEHRDAEADRADRHWRCGMPLGSQPGERSRHAGEEARAISSRRRRSPIILTWSAQERGARHARGEARDAAEASSDPPFAGGSRDQPRGVLEQRNIHRLRWTNLCILINYCRSFRRIRSRNVADWSRCSRSMRSQFPREGRLKTDPRRVCTVGPLQV